MQSLRARPVHNDLVLILILAAGPIENDAILAGVYVPIAVLLRPDLLDHVRRRVREDGDVSQHVIRDRAEPGHAAVVDADEAAGVERTETRREASLPRRNVARRLAAHRVAKTRHNNLSVSRTSPRPARPT